MAIIHHSPRADVDIPDRSITAHVFRNASEHPDRVALIDGPSGRSYTYSGLFGAVTLAAQGFRTEGIGTGDVVAIMAPNVPEYAIVFHGAVSAGGTVTTINPTYGPEEVAFQLGDAGAADAGHRRPVPRDGPRRGGRGRRGPTHRRDRRVPRARPTPSSDLLARRGRRSRRSPSIPTTDRRAAVLERHHRPAEGRDAHPPQPRREPRADRGPPRRWTTTRSRSAVLPFFHIYGMHGDHERRPARAGRRS